MRPDDVTSGSVADSVWPIDVGTPEPCEASPALPPPAAAAMPSELLSSEWPTATEEGVLGLAHALTGAAAAPSLLLYRGGGTTIGADAQPRCA